MAHFFHPDKKTFEVLFSANFETSKV